MESDKNMVKNVLWVSRHKPLDSQRKELESMYGKPLHIVMISESITKVDDILDHCIDDTIAIMAVLPVDLLSALVKRSTVPVLRAVMKYPEGDRTNAIPEHAGFVEVLECEYTETRL